MWTHKCIVNGIHKTLFVHLKEFLCMVMTGGPNQRALRVRQLHTIHTKKEWNPLINTRFSIQRLYNAARTIIQLQLPDLINPPQSVAAYRQHCNWPSWEEPLPCHIVFSRLHIWENTRRQSQLRRTEILLNKLKHSDYKWRTAHTMEFTFLLSTYLG